MSFLINNLSTLGFTLLNQNNINVCWQVKKATCMLFYFYTYNLYVSVSLI